MACKILLLGGTTGAREIAEVLSACPQSETIASLAGVTTDRIPYPLPTRIGGFGGEDGLHHYLLENRIDLVVDATHPYAAQMSTNAYKATRRAGVPLIALNRPEWIAEPGDNWTHVRDFDAVVNRLKRLGARKVFLPLGRKEVARFEAAPRHNYLIRAIERTDQPLNLPNATYYRARPPFDKAGEIELMRRFGIELMIVKNSGGSATYAKILAARELGIPVWVIKRPHWPGTLHYKTVAETLAAIVETAHHLHDRELQERVA